MAPSWTAIDWDAPRPDGRAVNRSRSRLRYEPTSLSRVGVDPVVSALRQTHRNGGALVARFRVVDDDEVIGWFASRNRFSEFGFFAHFLGSAAVRTELPDLRVSDPLDRGLTFTESWSGTLSLDGELAAILVHGGAYGKFTGTSVEAKQLGSAFVDAVVGARHEQFHVYLSHRAWNPWFHDVAWDSTYLLIDDADKAITLLCVTDTD